MGKKSRDWESLHALLVRWVHLSRFARKEATPIRRLQLDEEGTTARVDTAPEAFGHEISSIHQGWSFCDRGGIFEVSLSSTLILL